MVLTARLRIILTVTFLSLSMTQVVANEKNIDSVLFESFSRISEGGFRLQNKQFRAKEAQKTVNRIDITPLLSTAKSNWGVLRQETKDLVKPWLLRPTDSSQYEESIWRYTTPSTSIVSPGGHFRVHYVTTIDPKTNKDLTSTLSFAQTVAAEAEIVWSKIVGTQTGGLGYTQPPTDEQNTNNGGDVLYDIYLTNLVIGSGTNKVVIYGYVAPENVISGGTYPDMVNSYMVLDNDFSSEDFKYADPVIPLRVTLAHEFFHSVQFGYSYSESAAFMESSATWMEDIVFPTIHDNYQYIGEPFEDLNENNEYDLGESFIDHNGDGFRQIGSLRYPEFSVDYFSSSFAIQYGRFLWFRYLSEKFDNNIIKDIWELYGNIAGDNSLEGMDEVLKSENSSLSDAYQEYATWGYDKEKFLDGQNYPLVHVDRIMDGPDAIINSSDSPRLISLQGYLHLRDTFQVHLSTSYTQINSPSGDYMFQANSGKTAITMLVDTGQAELTHDVVELRSGRGTWTAPVGALKAIAVVSNVGMNNDEVYWGICRESGCFSIFGFEEDNSGGCLNISSSDSFFVLLVLLSLFYHARRRNC